MNDPRPLPEYVTSCFSSKIKDKIERALIRAHLEGYTKEEIRGGFEEWLATAKHKEEIRSSNTKTVWLPQRDFDLNCQSRNSREFPVPHFRFFVSANHGFVFSGLSWAF